MSNRGSNPCGFCCCYCPVKETTNLHEGKARIQHHPQRTGKSHREKAPFSLMGSELSADTELPRCWGWPVSKTSVPQGPSGREVLSDPDGSVGHQAQPLPQPALMLRLQQLEALLHLSSCICREANTDLEADPGKGRSCLINASAPFLLTLQGSRSPRPAHGILHFSPGWEDGFEVHICFSDLRTCQPLLQWHTERIFTHPAAGTAKAFRK